MKKRLLCLLFALLFIFTAAPFALALEEEFSDDDFFLDPYDFHDLLEHDLEIEALNLDLPTTRERATVYLVMGRNPGLLTSGTLPSNRFNDVPMSRWSFPAVTLASATGREWIVGTGNNNFSPDRNVTREEFAVMLVRAFNPPASNQQLNFTDNNQIASWARESVRLATAHGWILGFPAGGNRYAFHPQETITRRHALLMTQRAIDSTEGISHTILDPVVQTITWNQNGGTNVVNWQRIRGHAIGPLPATTRASYTRNDHWFNTANITGGTRTTASTHVPNSNVTYTARWHNLTSSTRHMNQWNHSNVIPIRTITGPDATWTNAIRGGMTTWSGTSTSISFNHVAQGNNTIVARTFEWTDLGRYYRRESTGTTATGLRVTRFDIHLQTETITNYHRDHRARLGHTLSDIIQSVTIHELGHALGLGDNPGGTTNNSIMNFYNTLLVPTAFDVRSVNLLFAN